VAEKYNVGAATVLAMLNLGQLNCVVLGDMIYIPDIKLKEKEDISIE
jgi:hypothetical protein